MPARRMRSKEELVKQIVYFTLLPIMRSGVIHRQTKIRLYKTVIRPVLCRASESWTLAKKSELALDAFERKVLRRIFGPMKENDARRIRYNNELYKQFDEPSLSDIIKLKRLQWAGHVQRMEGKRIPKRILESNSFGKRPVGKPRKRWINAVEIDSREILKVRNWKRESLDRQVWRRYLKEAKARLRAVAP
jgi:hypothetical protein